MKLNPAAIVGQVILYGAFAAFIGYFATNPRYQHIAPDRALLKLSFAHFGDRDCRKRSAEELQKLPPNMRAPMECPRERADILLHADLDGQPLYHGLLHPTGIAKDGISTIYRRFELPAGKHLLSVKMNDNARVEGFKFVKEAEIDLKPAQVLVVDFNPDKGGLFFQ